VSSLRKITAAPRDSLLWVTLKLKVGKIPALVDTGAQFSCVTSGVAEFLYLTGESRDFKSCALSCLLADGRRCQITDAVRLHVKLLSFSWDHEFQILKEGPFPAILGLEFLTRTRMMVNAASRTFSFDFAPDCIGSLSVRDGTRENEVWLQSLCDEVVGITVVPEVWPSSMTSESIIAEFPALFSSALGTAACAPYEIEMVNSDPVRSPPFWCAPPKLAIFKTMVAELLEQGVIRPSKSPFASPAFLVPKSGGGFRMVVDYRKVNSKIVFDSYPMPTIDQAFEQFAGAVVFSVLDQLCLLSDLPIE
jgi:hypothetical protein